MFEVERVQVCHYRACARVDALPRYPLQDGFLKVWRLNPPARWPVCPAHRRRACLPFDSYRGADVGLLGVHWTGAPTDVRAGATRLHDAS